MSPPKLLDQLRDALRRRHYSHRTEKAYVDWSRRFILYHDKRHPEDMGAEELTQFLSWLASVKKVSASTQNQALAALLFLYRVVLRRELEGLDSRIRARQQRRLPVILSRDEVRAVLRELHGMSPTYGLIGTLLYGGGLRLMECLRLRVRDIDFVRHQITMRDGKGGKDCPVILPRSAEAPLEHHLRKVGELPGRPRSEPWNRAAALRPRAQVPASCLQVGMAMALSGDPDRPGSQG